MTVLAAHVQAAHYLLREECPHLVVPRPLERAVCTRSVQHLQLGLEPCLLCQLCCQHLLAHSVSEWAFPPVYCYLGPVVRASSSSALDCFKNLDQ